MKVLKMSIHKFGHSNLGAERSRAFVTLRAHPDNFYTDLFFAIVSSRTSNLLVHHGRHFGRTVHAMCSVQALITNAIVRIGQAEGDEVAEELLTPECVLVIDFAH